MEANSLTRLDVEPRLTSDIFGYILSQTAGKTVLNVGAAGGVQEYLPHNREIWLHHRLGRTSRELVGTDIDEDGIEHARKHGVEILRLDCEVMQLGRDFDAIVMSDVVEHLDGPVRAICNLMRHLAPGGRMYLTTPNPTAFNAFARVLLRRELNVFWDHVSCYLPEHIQTICDRHGYCMKELRFFDHIDRQSVSNQFKSYLAKAASRINPRWATAFLAVIEKRPVA